MATLGCATKLALTYVQRRGGAAGPAVDAALRDIAERLARLETATDATAIEVERLGEGQRFTARLLNERATERGRAAPGADPAPARVFTPR